MTRQISHLSVLASLLVVLSLGGCFVRCGGPPVSGAAGFNPIAPLGSETWDIDGTPHQVAATYYLHLPEGFQFTIEVPVSGTPPTDEAAALVQAWPYMRYAYETKRHLRTTVSKVGDGQLSTDRIGVALFQRDGVATRAYRVSLPVQEIEDRVRGGA
jgi:hypothetical protein